MNLGYNQGEMRLLYLGIGLPLWFYLIFFYSKWFNRIIVKSDSVIIKNIFWGQKTIIFSEIEKWNENYIINTFSRSLLLYVNGNKVIVSNMSDKKNYETLLNKLRSDNK